MIEPDPAGKTSIVSSTSTDPSITVSAPARLHMGFLDMSGELGRGFGSFGLTISGIETRLRIAPADDIIATGPGAERARRSATAILGRMGSECGVRVEVEAAIPEHAGLGSGTQLSLALASGITRMLGHRAGIEELALLTGRGARSGIGIAAFEQGGFLIDGGRGSGTQVPPLLCRQPFPEQWRVLLVFDESTSGLNGEAERQAFSEIPPMPETMSGRICRNLLMRVLPALIEQRFGDFCHGIAAIQEDIGDYFAAYQGGGRYTSARVAEVMEWLGGEGIVGCGQTSWGPTGFALLENELEAGRLLRGAQAQWPDLKFGVYRGRNEGARISGDWARMDPVGGRIASRKR
ncbi:MAG: GHMP kinase [Gammaproteobacteria bacterium]|nr:MAG: GHMP kinase [Gammaproteobacteria bacterium]